MALAKIKKNDHVKILAGKDKGKTGQVLYVLTEENKVVVQGINVATFHQKPNPQAQREGGIQKKELPIALSNVARYDMASGKVMKLGVRTLKDGKKVWFDKKTDQVLED